MTEVNWKLRKAPELLKLEKGELFMGRVQQFEVVRVDGKPIKQVMLFGKHVKKPGSQAGVPNEIYKMLLGADLSQKIFPYDQGRLIAITYVGDDAQAGREGNAMRIYEVKIGEETTDDAFQATDDDIPF